MWNTLSAAIVTKVQASTKLDGTNVFDYGKASFTSYPSVTITPSDDVASFADNLRNRREYSFMVRIYQERLEGGQGEKEAERILRILVDDLISLFDTDLTLGATLKGRGFVYAVPGKWGYVKAPDIDVRLAEITVKGVVVQ